MSTNSLQEVIAEALRKKFVADCYAVEHAATALAAVFAPENRAALLDAQLEAGVLEQLRGAGYRPEDVDAYSDGVVVNCLSQTLPDRTLPLYRFLDGSGA